MKRLFIITVICFISLTLCGCWGRVDINKLVTASAIGVDETEIGYRVTVQAINASSLTKELSNRSTIVVFTEEGRTFFEALRKITRFAPSRIFIAHFRLVAFGEEFAKSGKVKEVLGFLYNNQESRQKFNFIVVKDGKAEDLLKILTPLSPNPASELNESIKFAHDVYGISHLIYQDEFLSCLMSNENNPVITGVEIVGDPKKGSELKSIESSELKGKYKISGLGVFKGNKLAGWLSEEQSQGFNFEHVDIVSSVIPVNYGDNLKVSVELREPKKKEKFILKNNEPTVNISLKFDGILNGLEEGSFKVTEKEIKEIEDVAAKNIKQKVDSAIYDSQNELNSDFFKIGALIHRSKPKYWKEIKDKYDEIYKTIKINVNVKVNIINTPQ